MKSKTLRTIRHQAIALGCTLGFALPAVALAQFNGNFGLDNLAGQTNLGNRPLVDTIGAIINVILGFLGVIALIIILLGGFKWMTSGGSEDKIGESKKLMGAGIAGLAIVLAAWAIAQFVISQLGSATQAS